MTVAAGAALRRRGDPAARPQGLALANLASLPHISVAGAVATGTHGSGDGNRQPGRRRGRRWSSSPPTATCSPSTGADGDRFAGMVVSLGALGVVTRVTLDVVPTFDMRQYVREGLPVEALDEAFGLGVQRQPVHRLARRPDRPGVAQAARRRPTARRPDWLGTTRGRPARRTRCPGCRRSAAPPQLGEPGPWHERLPHFRLGFTAEQRRRAAVRVPPAPGGRRPTRWPRCGAMRGPDRRRCCRSASCVPSPPTSCGSARNYGRDSVAVHFTWVDDAAAVLPVLAEVEAAAGPVRRPARTGARCSTSTRPWSPPPTPGTPTSPPSSAPGPGRCSAPTCWTTTSPATAPTVRAQCRPAGPARGGC